MRWFLKATPDGLSLELAPNYSNAGDVERLLRQFSTNRTAMQTLREAIRCTEASAQTQLLSDEDVFRLAAEQIVAGRLTLIPDQPAPLFPVFFHKGSS